MSEKTFKIVDGDMSDGYHTFDELYEHRCLLFLSILRLTANKVFCKDHFDGWDLVRIETAYGQISYHVPSKYRSTIEEHCPEISKEEAEATFDGHTSKDVIKRLEKLIGFKNDN